MKLGRTVACLLLALLASGCGTETASVAQPLNLAAPSPVAVRPTAPRVRQNVRNLTPQQRRQLVNAFKRLKQTPSPYDSRYNYYDQFVIFHQRTVVESAAAGYGLVHMAAVFPPWHRLMLRLFEDALNEVSDAPLALPYWDWTDPDSTAALLSDELMGPGGAVEEGYAVTSGPFRRGEWTVNVFPAAAATRATSPHDYLVRGLGLDVRVEGGPQLPTLSDVQQVLMLGTYDVAPYDRDADLAVSFRNNLEGWRVDKKLHNVGHNYIGGVFTLNGQPQAGQLAVVEVSPNDPIFYLHHANVDRVYDEWLKAHPGVYLPESGSNYGWNLDDPMFPFRDYADNPRVARYGVTPRSMLSSAALGYRYEAGIPKDPNLQLKVCRCGVSGCGCGISRQCQAQECTQEPVCHCGAGICAAMTGGQGCCCGAGHAHDAAGHDAGPWAGVHRQGR